MNIIPPIFIKMISTNRKQLWFVSNIDLGKKILNLLKKKFQIKQLVDKSLVGYNSTAMAYGVTGTGKTHTMFGDIRNKMENPGVQQGFYLNDLNYDYRVMHN